MSQEEQAAETETKDEEAEETSEEPAEEAEAEEEEEEEDEEEEDEDEIVDPKDTLEEGPFLPTLSFVADCRPSLMSFLANVRGISHRSPLVSICTTVFSLVNTH